jgi:hypothetical protein
MRFARTSNRAPVRSARRAACTPAAARSSTCGAAWPIARRTGHPGSGGSVGFANPDAGVGFGYVPNLWSWNIAERRAKSLAAAVVACLG